MTKAAPVKVGRHRNKVQEHSSTDKYMPGKARPCDYADRHAEPSEGLEEEEKEHLKANTGEVTQVERVSATDLPHPATQGAEGGGG
jgi:hypothetical protein